ncbi:MAG: RHS repeat-associated core domain-containing protein, partial [Oscillospiraceae bacterium]|nr:RHS repeat-associated core domain-containing protein [Oscillospiraceae bacterium]
MRGNGKLIAEDIAGSLSYYFFNAHGDVINRVNGSNGEVLKTYNYDSFGNIINPPTVGDPNDPIYVDQSPFGYAGEYFDKENREIYLRARYYNSEYGRFVTEDPAKHGTNWYSYCENNPVTMVDGTGLEPTTDGSLNADKYANDYMIATYYKQQASAHPELGPQPQLEKPKSSGSSEGASASKEETTVAMLMNLMFNSSILNFAWFMSKRNNNIIFDNIQPTITNIFNTVAEDTVVESVARAISHGYVVSNLIPAFSGAKVLGGVDVVAKSNYILKNANTIVKTAPIVSVALDY